MVQTKSRGEDTVSGFAFLGQYRLLPSASKCPWIRHTGKTVEHTYSSYAN
jgi:hypothetical protein